MILQPRAERRSLYPDGFPRPSWIVVVCFGWLVGCSSSSVQSVDEPKAKRALVTTLESWKKGDPIGSLKEQKPSIVAQDLDWEFGQKLIQYNLLDEGKVEAVNLSIPVELTIQDKTGKEIKKKVKYMVGTSPVITVFREIF